MDKLLVAAGIALIIFILWKDRSRESRLHKEKEDDRKLLVELNDARREVRILLEQLEIASEKIVDEISNGLEEIKMQVSSAIERPVDGSPVNASLREEPDEKEVLPKHQLVYAMADMGHTEEEIAKEMKIGKGEVSLLLQLRRKGEEGNV